MKALRLILPAAALLAAFVGASVVSWATPAYSKKEKKPCVTCHVKAGKKDLNDVGKYYHEKKSLEGAPQK